MIDMFSLLVSIGLTALVVYRAIRLDREVEWFPRVRSKEEVAKAKRAAPPPPNPRAWRR